MKGQVPNMGIYAPWWIDTMQQLPQKALTNMKTFPAKNCQVLSPPPPLCSHKNVLAEYFEDENELDPHAPFPDIFSLPHL